ncbi:RarD [Desulforapulum autotrophicum HRM2]|uniref:RarD n=1 Tax=Desulforapulum autotrophicum (strain ATCC 43914 / DSM 3382 / VKM B-1955 / HRM2) TaxID=177437 RepID=C0QJS6_DESAH|nr:EamA family transporter RarD [Desulforapulum autotrophicum]ACN13929.1 RarD [Desulforapulum autotrophicum HRM2]
MTQPICGILFGLAAFTSWGFLPAYWKQMQAVTPFEILCHRIVWSCIFLGIIISLQKRWGEVAGIARTPAKLRALVLSGLIIGTNWFVYIWAVNSGRVVETSLGYYINPMINVLIGFFLLGERFSRLQYIAVFFALAGVVYSLSAYGDLPLFALALAVSFAFYGYARKKIQAAPLPGLLIETMVLLVPALAYIIFKQVTMNSFFLKDPGLTLWMIGAGVVTSLPLLWFAESAKRLNLSTLGILQYLAPSIAFMLGVFVYKESFTRHNLITFTCIWMGVFLYAWESLKKSRRQL